MITHAIEPKYPGAVESLVDISACWDEDMLYDCRGEILRIAKSCRRCHEHACRFLSAAGSLAGDTYRIALDSVNTTKLAGYCGRLSEREFKQHHKTPGKERVRFLSAVTNKGPMKFTDTAKALCDRIYLLGDDHGAVSRLLLNNVRRAALDTGYDIISCYCPLGPFDKLEHIFVPELCLGFMTSNRFHDFTMEVTPYRIVNSQRFTDSDKLKSSKRRISFNRKVMSQMIGQASALLAEANTLHDELESYYISATNFDRVEELTRRLLDKVTGIQCPAN